MDFLIVLMSVFYVAICCAMLFGLGGLLWELLSSIIDPDTGFDRDRFLWALGFIVVWLVAASVLIWLPMHFGGA